MRTPGESIKRRQPGRSEALVGASDPAFVDCYLRRVGLTIADVVAADLDDQQILERIVRAQLAAIPFENLMIHAGQVVDVDPAAIERKILGDNRGGICYELNALLARALRGIGFDVRLVGAAVVRDCGTFGPALGHMVVIATSGDRRWLVDTGFGGSSVLARITGAQAESPLDITTSTGRYRTDGISYHLGDFATIARWQSTSPQARFTAAIICSITDDTHRITMSRAPSEQFTLTRTNLATGERTRDTVPGDDVRSLFDTHFGIALNHTPAVAEFA